MHMKRKVEHGDCGARDQSSHASDAGISGGSRAGDRRRGDRVSRRQTLLRCARSVGSRRLSSGMLAPCLIVSASIALEGFCRALSLAIAAAPRLARW